MRPARSLMLAKGTLYIGVGSCHSGWLLSDNAQNLRPDRRLHISTKIDGEGTYGACGRRWMGSVRPCGGQLGECIHLPGNGPWKTRARIATRINTEVQPVSQVASTTHAEDYGGVH